MDDNFAPTLPYLIPTLFPALSFGLLLFLNYPGFNATFTNLGSSGREGTNSVGSHYEGQDHDGQVTLSGGIQQWTVPYTGQYRIKAVGSAGGYNTKQSRSQYRGRGAKMVGTFNLLQNEKIQILIGQEGEIRNNYWSAGDGGGGTFVVTESNTPLIVAGGGGGLKAVKSRHQGCDASTSTSGNSGYRSSWSGGRNGEGGTTGNQNHDRSGEGNRNTYFHFTKHLIRVLSPDLFSFSI